MAEAGRLMAVGECSPEDQAQASNGLGAPLCGDLAESLTAKKER